MGTLVLFLAWTIFGQHFSTVASGPLQVNYTNSSIPMSTSTQIPTATSLTLSAGAVNPITTLLLSQMPTSSSSLPPDGRWYGSVDQSIVPAYSVIITLQNCTIQSVCGSIQYPELSCSGTLTFLDSEAAPHGDRYRFAESITDGIETCVSTTVTLEPTSTNSWLCNWYYAGLLVSDAILDKDVSGATETATSTSTAVNEPSYTPTSTHTATFTPTLTRTPTPTPTGSRTSTFTPTPTRTPTHTSISTPTATSTSTPIPPIQDPYELDNACTQARSLSPDGIPQRHTFHVSADEDWVVFDGVAGRIYRIEAQLPPDSRADVVLELYDACAGNTVDNFDKPFTPGVRLDFAAPTTGPIYLRLFNNDASVFGPSVGYDLSVRPLRADPEVGAAILVAGRLKYGDSLQPNIRSVIERVYTLFVDHKYTNDELMVIATDSSLPGYDRSATLANLEWAITQWAPEHLSPGDPFTIYMMSHGIENTFYLDGPNNQLVTPALLDSWLDQLQAAVPGLKVNLIIEACQSGSFIFNTQRLVGPGRVIITSAGRNNDAYASADGAYFSDYFIVALYGSHIYSSFLQAKENVQKQNSIQTPQLEGNGNGVPNEDGDYVIASLRGFGFPGTFGDPWPPYIAQAEGPTAITNRRGIVRAEVRDDSSVRTVWAVVYPPSYQPPATSGQLVPEPLTKILFSRQNDGWYAGEYTGFDEAGTYRIVIQATDNKDLSARPVVVEMQNGGRVFLPAVMGR